LIYFVVLAYNTITIIIVGKERELANGINV